MLRNAAKYYKPYLWGSVGGGIVLITLAVFFAWQTMQALPEAKRVGDAAIDALVRLDQPQFNQLAYCPNCALRTWAQWLNLVRSSGIPKTGVSNGQGEFSNSARPVRASRRSPRPFS